MPESRAGEPTCLETGNFDKNLKFPLKGVRNVAQDLTGVKGDFCVPRHGTSGEDPRGEFPMSFRSSPAIGPGLFPLLFPSKRIKCKEPYPDKAGRGFFFRRKPSKGDNNG